MARAAKPDPRPMRLAFGAGAVAAVSAVTFGMVRPDFTGAGSGDAYVAPSADQAQAAAPEADVSVRRVTNYVLLKPGEKAPRGATVITTNELLGLGDQPAKPDRQTARQPEAQSAPQPERQSNQQTAPAPKPQPDPPRVSTRQSGS